MVQKVGLWPKKDLGGYFSIKAKKEKFLEIFLRDDLGRKRRTLLEKGGFRRTLAEKGLSLKKIGLWPVK